MRASPAARARPEPQFDGLLNPGQMTILDPLIGRL